MSGYTATLENQKEIYIPHWPVDVALENLSRASKYLGAEAVIQMSEVNIPAVILAIMESKDPNQTASLIKHFICQARVSGDKIESSQIDNMFEGDLAGVAEIFTHVIAAQYADFFASGLAKVRSPAL